MSVSHRLTSPNPDSAPTLTLCHGVVLAALRIGWALIAAIVFVPAIASFGSLLEHNTIDALTRAGSFAIDAEIITELQAIGLSRDFLLQADLVFRLVGWVIFALTGIVLFVRKSDDWMTVLASVMLISTGATWFAPLGLLPTGSALESVSTLIGRGTPIDVTLGASIAGLSALLFLYLFPDGRFVPRWTRVTAAIVTGHFLLWASFRGSVFDATTWSPPFEAALVFAVVGSGLVAQVYRYFAVATPIQKQQTKLVVAAIVAVIAVPILLLLATPGLGSGLEDLTVVTPRVEALYDLILLAILGLALIMVPISIAVSIFRYRLWDIDALINRTLVYGTLTGILGLAYFTILAVVSSLAEESRITAAAAALGVAVLFHPLRRRLQNLIDRQFFRQRYDAARTLEEFAARLRQSIDLDTLSDELISLVESTLFPTGVSLWVSRSSEGAAGAGTAAMHRIAFRVSGGSDNIRGPDFDEVILDDEAIAILVNAGGPMALDESSLSSTALQRFSGVNVRLVVPLVTQGKLIGMLNLGPRMSETDYSSDDHKLLDGLSGNAAAAVHVALLVREHEADTREKGRIENEMRVAQLIQRQLVPKDLPQLAGWNVYAYYNPAREVGGDFYDFIHLPDGRLALIVGDVTGKGVPAALVMASTRSILRGEAPRILSPGLILQRTNEQLVNDIPAEMFVTCFCAVVDPATGHMVYANAGHCLPFLRGGGEVTEVRATGMPLGLLPGVAYEEHEMILNPASSLVLHSDGLAEALNGSREMFGLPRMKRLIEGCSEPELIIDQLLDAVKAFTGEGWEQDDDITLAVMHRNAAATRLSGRDPQADQQARRPVPSRS